MTNLFHFDVPPSFLLHTKSIHPFTFGLLFTIALLAFLALLQNTVSFRSNLKRELNVYYSLI